MRTTFSVSLILHFYGETTNHILCGSEVYSDEISRLIAEELLERVYEPRPEQLHCKLTERGLAYAKLLCSTPLPVKAEGFQNPWTGDFIQ